MVVAVPELLHMASLSQTRLLRPSPASKVGKRGKAATGKAKQKTAAKLSANDDAPPDSRKRKAPATAAAAGDDGLTPGKRQRSKMDAR